MSNNQEESFQAQPQLPNPLQNIPSNQPEPIQQDNQTLGLPPQFGFINKINRLEYNSQETQTQFNNSQNPNIQNFNNNTINVVNTDKKNNINEINNNNKNEEIVSEPNKTKLQNRFSFWYRIDEHIQ